MAVCAIHVCMDVCMGPLGCLVGISLIVCKSEHFQLWVEILGYTWDNVLLHMVVIIVVRFMRDILILFLHDVLVVLAYQLMRKTVIAKYVQLIKVKQFY